MVNRVYGVQGLGLRDAGSPRARTPNNDSAQI